MLICNQVEVETLIPVLFLSPGEALEKMDAVCLSAVFTQATACVFLCLKAVVMSILAQKPSLYLWYPTESQSHKTVGTGRDVCRSPGPISLLKQGLQDQGAQKRV